MAAQRVEQAVVARQHREDEADGGWEDARQPREAVRLVRGRELVERVEQDDERTLLCGALRTDADGGASSPRREQRATLIECWGSVKLQATRTLGSQPR